MKLASSAITLLAVASSAAAFTPIQSSRGPVNVAVQSSLSDSLSLASIESEVSEIQSW